MTTITALNVRLGMDVSNFSEGANLAKAETNRVAAIMRQSVPPAEKYKQELDLLNRAFSEAGKQSKEYASAVEFLRKKHGQLAPDTKAASAEIDRLKQSMLSAVPGGNMLAGALKSPAAAALALAAASAIAMRQIMKTATEIDVTAKAARSLGTSYTELIAIQKLGADAGGMDAESMNRNMSQFVKRLAEARVNGGALKETLNAIGLDVNSLAAMDASKSFRMVADAIAGIPDKAEQIRVAVALVGKEGVKMVEVFRQGSGAIDQAVIDAQRLGTAISDEAAQSVEVMNDNFGFVGMAITGIWNSVTTSLAPALTDVAKIMADVLVLTRKVGSTLNDTVPIIDAISVVVSLIADGLRTIIALENDIISMVPGWLIGDFNAEFTETNRLLDEVSAEMNGAAAGAKIAAEQAEALAIETERAAEAAAKQVEKFEDRVRLLEIEQIELKGGVDLARQMRLQIEGYTQAQIQSLTALEKQNKAIKDQAEATKELKKLESDRQKERESAERDFHREVEAANRAASAFFEKQRKDEEQRRKDVSAGPGGGIEAGSAGAAKFMADAVNTSIGAATMPAKATPGEQQIVNKTAELLIAQREANAKQQQQIELAKGVLAEMKENGFRRIR